MNPEKEAYEEARRRIREADQTGAPELDLRRLVLTRLPPELKRLISLQTLNLSHCEQLSDFSVLADLPSLRTLNLARQFSAQDGLFRSQSCAPSDSKQLTDLSFLTGLISLRSLDLSGCKQLSDLSPLTRLTSLQSLNLSSCVQLSDISSLIRNTALQSLDLSWCKGLSDMSPLMRLTSLQSLNFSGYKKFKDFYFLTSLTDLQTLKLYSCEQLSDLSPLAALTGLQTLDLSGCKQLSDLSPLAALTSLQSLDLSICKKISDLSPLVGITSLQSLNLSFCEKVSDLSPLARLTSLQSLNLSCLRVGRFGPIQSLLPTLKDLRLDGCKLDDLPPEVCSGYRDENVLDKVRANFWQIFISYAWGDISPNASEADRQRQEVVERLCQMLEKDSWNILRDSDVLRPGELISGFMNRIGLADHVIVVLSDKYLRSPYCMTELYSIYQQSIGEKEDFLRRIIPLRLSDARFGTWRDRVAYAEHWEKEFKAMEQHLSRIGQADFRLYQETKKWYVDVGDMLAYVNDVLHPHGFDEIVKDDFASLRHMLLGRR